MAVLTRWNWYRSRRAQILGLGLALVSCELMVGCGRSEPTAAAVTQPGARRNEMADYMKTHPPAKIGKRAR